MKRVLVTGATGFIGRQCLRILGERGFEVHAVTHDEVDQAGGEVRWYRADLLDRIAVGELVGCVKPIYLLHLAWYVAPGSYQSSLDNLRWVQASIDLLQAFALHGGKRAVAAGTCFEYDARYGYCSESITPLRPVTLYGACKHALQTVSASSAEEMGLSTAWGRVFFLYGPHEQPTRLVPSIVGRVLRNETATCRYPTLIRDFLHVRDVATAFCALLESEVAGPVNIGSGQAVSLGDLALRVAREIGREELVEFASSARLGAEPQFLVAAVDRLTNEVGWQPEYDLDRGLADTIAWWKRNLAEDDVAS